MRHLRGLRSRGGVIQGMISNGGRNLGPFGEPPSTPMVKSKKLTLREKTSNLVLSGKKHTNHMGKEQEAK